MIYFNCDYNEGAHPAILKSLRIPTLNRLSDTVKTYTVRRRQK